MLYLGKDPVGVNHVDPVAQAEIDEIQEEVTELKSALNDMSSATIEDEGKALKAKTVNNGKVTEWEFGNAGGITASVANILLEILGEGVYGSDQTANIELLRKALMDIKPVSISAVLNSVPLVNLHYSDLDFTVTATFDDSSTMVVDGYKIVTPGSVVAGTNTVSVSYKGVTTNTTFTASDIQTYLISYELTNTESTNNDYMTVAGERYTTKISAFEDYGLDSIQVLMGGVDITDNALIGDTITIAEVTGDVVITASAIAYVYMPALIPMTRNVSACSVYRGADFMDDSTRIFNMYYVGSTNVSEYPALRDCTLHWTLTNNTDSDLSISNTGFGAVPCNNPAYPDNSMGSITRILYGVVCKTSSNVLSSGHSIEGDYTLRAGHQFVFFAPGGTIDSFTVSVRGTYVEDTFDDFDILIKADYKNQYYGSYRDVTMYSDDGVTEIGTVHGWIKKLTDSLSAGEYDFWYRFASRDRDIGKVTGGYGRFFIGAVENESSAASHYASITPPGSKARYLWTKSRIRVLQDGMTIVFIGGVNNLNEADDEHIDIRMKEVIN